MYLCGDLLMSQLRANIWDHLTQHSSCAGSLPSTAIVEKFSELHRLEHREVSLALDDLRHLGLIDISAGTVTLTHLALRLSR